MNSRALVALAAAALLTACDLGTVVEVAEVGNVELNTETEPVQLGNTIQLNATVTSDRGEPLNRSVNFSSSNTAIAEVSSSGLVTTRAPGTATITASADGASDDATIHVVELPCPVNGTLRPGDSESSVLDGPCVLNVDGSLVDMWFLEVPNSATIQIDQTSTAFDPFLFLLDSSLGVIAQNNDGGGGGNARITAALSPGVFVIFANSLQAGESGSYQLSVSEL